MRRIRRSFVEKEPTAAMVSRRLRVLAAAVALSALPFAAVAQQPAPDSLDEARERLDQLEDQAAGAEAQLEAARDELEALEPRMRESSQQLAQAQDEADAARRAAAKARRRAERVEERLAEARASLRKSEDELASLARDAYMYGPAAAGPVLGALEQLSETSNPNEVADVMHMIDVALGGRSLVIQEYARLIEETATLTEEAERTRQAREQEAAAARAAEARAAEQHAEMMALLDEADRAVAVERRALAQLESERDSVQERIGKMEAARERALAEARRAIRRVSAGADLVTVGGITVHASLAPQLEKLLEAARADGIVLGGSGYRSPETTARLRRANGCPDVYESPASSCRVPTARPGSSMHEQGLAIDFTYQGQTICYPNPPSRCSGNAAFDWLQAHAADFGLQNLHTEAWHWSTNGN